MIFSLIVSGNNISFVKHNVKPKGSRYQKYRYFDPIIDLRMEKSEHSLSFMTPCNNANCCNHEIKRQEEFFFYKIATKIFYLPFSIQNVFFLKKPQHPPKECA